MKRIIYDQLIQWIHDRDRRPLLLEGVRQCGKTYILNQLGAEHFTNTVYCNFEKMPILSTFFEKDLDPRRIMTEIEILFNTKITAGKTLLIFDEIQQCPNAITSLKYFCEEAGEIHVAAAGSLLGLLTSKPKSFPVGKVERMTMRPMSFYEFLMADGHDMLAERMMAGDPTEPLPKALNDLAEDELRMFFITGGMPKVVESWTNERDLRKVSKLQSQILADYEDDMAKHGGEMLPTLIRIWHSIPGQLFKENNRFMFKEVGFDRSADAADPVQWLVSAGLLIRVKRTDNINMPLSESDDDNLYKLFMSDIGLLRCMADVPPNYVQTDDEKYKYHKGGITENFVITEMTGAYPKGLHYWTDGKYEVDLIVESNLSVVPIEIKSGRRVKAKSLARYIDKYAPERIIAVSMEEAKKGRVESVPLYCAGSLKDILEKD